jgi:hypothetical protein
MYPTRWGKPWAGFGLWRGAEWQKGPGSATRLQESPRPLMCDGSRGKAEAPRGPRPFSYVLADVRFLLRGYHPLSLVSLGYAPALSQQGPGHSEGYPDLDYYFDSQIRVEGMALRAQLQHPQAQARERFLCGGGCDHRGQAQGAAQRGAVGPPSEVL